MCNRRRPLLNQKTVNLICGFCCKFLSGGMFNSFSVTIVKGVSPQNDVCLYYFFAKLLLATRKFACTSLSGCSLERSHFLFVNYMKSLIFTWCSLRFSQKDKQHIQWVSGFSPLRIFLLFCFLIWNISSAKLHIHQGLLYLFIFSNNKHIIIANT